MKPFEEQFTAWVDDKLTGAELAEFEKQLAEHPEALAEKEEVRRLGFELDVVLCNAGIMALPERTIVHGQELQFLTNHIGHFILVQGLLESLSDARQRACSRLSKIRESRPIG